MVAGARTFSLEETFLSPQILNPPPTRHALLAFLLALTAVLHIGTAAWGDLYDGAEGELAGGARSMLDSQQWLLPSSNGAPLLDSPPLAYWAVAFSCKVFGLTAAAARLPIALAMLGSVSLIFLIGERLGGYWRGFSAGLIYVCSAGTFVLGRMITPDAFCSLFIAAAVYCAVRGYQHRKFRRAWFAGFWFATSLATLTRGPSALLYLAILLGGLSIFFREARFRFRGLLHWSGLGLFVALTVPWFVWANRTVPGSSGHLFGSTATADLPRSLFAAWHLAWWFPAILLIAPGLIFAPRKIFRPDEAAFGDFLPLGWLAVTFLGPLVFGPRHAFSALAASPAFALFAATAWERTSRSLHIFGIALGLAAGFAITVLTYLQPAVTSAFLARRLEDGVWNFLGPLVLLSAGSLLLFSVGAIFIRGQRREVSLAIVLAAMVPVGFCLVEARSRVAPYFSLADAARFLNRRLGESGEVVYEGSLRNASSLTFYLDKKFHLVDRAPAASQARNPAAVAGLDEHFLVEAWDRSDPIYLIVDESRVSYWRKLITDRVHIYHQVTSCGSRVVLSNQL